MRVGVAHSHIIIDVLAFNTHRGLLVQVIQQGSPQAQPFLCLVTFVLINLGVTLKYRLSFEEKFLSRDQAEATSRVTETLVSRGWSPGAE